MSTTTALSHYSEANVLKALFFNTDFPPAQDGTGGVEVAGNAYARQTVSGGTHNTGAGAGWTSIVTDATSSTITNANDILFPVATPSGWGTILGIGIYDLVSGGNLIALGVADSSVAINAGDQYKI